MKIEKSTVWSFILLILIASLYRVIPNRIPGFAPQIAMAIFAGSIISNKKFSFLLPLLSMFVSDALYEVLYRNNIGNIPGFYEGQLVNYIIFGSLTFIGFFVKRNKIAHILAGSVIGATTFFLVSNFISWTGMVGNGLDINNQPYAKTWEALMNCYYVALPFYRASLYATCLFSGVLFGGYYLLERYSFKKAIA